MRGSRFAIAYELSPMGRTVSSRAAIGVVGLGLALASVGCGGGSSGPSQASTTPTIAALVGRAGGHGGARPPARGPELAGGVRRTVRALEPLRDPTVGDARPA